MVIRLGGGIIAVAVDDIATANIPCVNYKVTINVNGGVMNGY